MFENGFESDVVISSRIRLARNLKEYPFPIKMNQGQTKEIKECIKNIFKDDNNYEYIELSDLTDIDLASMVEMHIISPELRNSVKQKGLIFSEKNISSIMINEEDHVRIQCLSSGLDMENLWEKCCRLDERIEENVEVAYSTKYGYLTSCPTNVGTGIRVSAMMHLPALVMSGYINNILEICGKLGIAVRGLYGENTKALGNMFQISNQLTLGQSEDEIIGNVKNIVFQIMQQERYIRSELLKNSKIKLEDRMFRAFGIFVNARILRLDEAFKLLSDIRLGIDMGILTKIDINKVNKIMFLMQPANLQKHINKPISRSEIDITRAEIIRNIIDN
jgi:protein arginine kinase